MISLADILEASPGQGGKRRLLTWVVDPQLVNKLLCKVVHKTAHL